MNVSAINKFVTGKVKYGNITLTGNEINLTGGGSSIRGNNSNIVLQSSTASQAIQIDSADSGNTNILDITSTDLAAIANGFNQITIDRSNSIGSLSITSNVNFIDPVLLSSSNININMVRRLRELGRGLRASLLGMVVAIWALIMARRRLVRRRIWWQI